MARTRVQAQNKSQSFLQGALILSVAAVISKVVGALFKIPLQKMAGMVAWGYFEIAYQFYLPIYTIAIAGLPLAVSRMVSESIALEQYRDVRTVYRLAIKIFLTCGLVGTLIMWIGADAYANFVGIPESRQCIVVMAPTVLFCCLVSAHRGLYEGTRNMIPTAVSQIIESLGKLVLGIGFGYAAMWWGQHQFAQGGTVFGQTVSTAQEATAISQGYVAAGAMLGVTIGSRVAVYHVVSPPRGGGDHPRAAAEFAAFPFQQSGVPRHYGDRYSHYAGLARDPADQHFGYAVAAAVPETGDGRRRRTNRA